MKIIIKCALLLFISSVCFSQAAPKLKKISVILDWFINPNHAPLFVAMEEGFFKKQGLKVKIIEPADPSDGPKMVAAGKMDVTIDYGMSLFMQINAGLPIIRMGSLVNTTLNALAVLKSSEFKKIKNLKGKMIGVSSPGTDHVILGAMLEKNGLRLKDVTLVNVKYGLVQALLTHKVSAISGIMRNVEPFEVDELLHKKQALRLFFPEKNGMPTYSELIWAINKKNVHKPWVNKFLAAIKEATVYLKAHPQTMWGKFAKKYPNLNNTINHASWNDTIKYFTNNPKQFSKPHYMRLSQFLKSKGFIDKIPSVTEYTISP